MWVTDDRLTEALVRGQPGSHLAETNPVAALIVESTATTYPQHAGRIRSAGRFLCDLLHPPGTGAPTLTLPVAMHTFVREEHTSAQQMRAHLGRTTHWDLLLGLSACALLACPRRHGRPAAGEADAVLRMVYLLVRMHEIQEETNELEQALNV